MKNRKAIVIGASGLVGSQLLRLLLNHTSYASVVSLVRRPSGIKHAKLVEQVVDFEKIESYGAVMQGDVLFSCMGTTINKAKTQEAQYQVDYTYQYNTAKLAKAQGVESYVLISSIGANPSSRVFYSRMKGELDRDVQTLGFEYISIVQPSVLDGKRNEVRVGERVGIVMGRALGYLPYLRKYRSIKGEEVAESMIYADLHPSEKVIFQADELFQMKL